MMNETKSQAATEYSVRVREPLPPDETAPVPFRMSRAGRIVDIVDLPSNVAVVQARLGRVRYSREEMRSSFAEFLALEPQEVKAGTYCVFTVMNVGAKPVEVTGKVLVEGEHGEVVEGLPLREATEDDAPTPVLAPRDAAGARNVRNAANDAIVDSIIDNAMMADGSPAKPSKSKSSKPATGRRPSPTPMTAPMPRAGALKPQKVMTRHARRQRYEAEATTTAAKSIAGGEMRVVLLHIGNVAMLDLALSARIPLGEDVRGEISAAIRANEHARARAARSESEAAVSDGVGVVAIHFTDADCERLSEAVDARAEYTLDDTEAMRVAIQQALDPKAAAPEATVAAAAASETVVHEDALEAAPVASTTTAAETAAPPTSVEKAEAGNVTPIHGKVQDDGRPQTTSVPVYGPSEASARR